MPCIKLTTAGNLPACPAGGSYTAGANVAVGPTCNITATFCPNPPT